ncbi:hypothetical protein [Azospirillum rugosum]|uniref:Type VI secretion system (T6SS), amidase immunity protein n=1 Tax=Azospirillum rugosum TaxID=416170 RepID=A0ABS4SUI0_9PROT|nr:hypothetical protein [Azospirillum rugosum]MBP2295879.1 hypothetical protein [Azospirillum rugosum]MDQ0530136.1 hypothetical protein [Azospirillum rugosum]
MLRALAVIMVALFANNAFAYYDAPNREAYLGHILCMRAMVLSLDVFLDACQPDSDESIRANIKRSIEIIDDFTSETFGISRESLVPSRALLNSEFKKLQSTTGGESFRNFCKNRMSELNSNGILGKASQQITKEDLISLSNVTMSACF